MTKPNTEFLPEEKQLIGKMHQKHCQLMSCLILSTMMPSVASSSLSTCTTVPLTLSLTQIQPLSQVW